MPPIQFVLPTHLQPDASAATPSGRGGGGGESSSKRVGHSSSSHHHTRDSPAAGAGTFTGGGPPVLLSHSPVDGPCQRMKDEWKDPWSWFGIDDCGRLLDVANSFGGTQTVWKWLIWLWLMASLCYTWSTIAAEEGGWLMGNLDHWGLLVSVIYATMSLANGHFQPPQPPTSSEGVNLYVKCFWIIFEIAAHLELLCAFLFWTIVFHQERKHNQDYDDPTKEGYTIGYTTFFLHGLVMMVVWLDGMVLNRIPVRVKHYFIVLPVDAVYICWTILHAAAGLDNGKTTATTETSLGPHSDAIYVALDWQDKTVQTVFIAIATLTFFAPLLFLFQYMMSLYTFPWTWNGSKSRRCIEFDITVSMSRSMPHHHHPPTGSTGNGSMGGSSGKHHHGPTYAIVPRPGSPTKKSSSQQRLSTSTNSEASRTTSGSNRNLNNGSNRNLNNNNNDNGDNNYDHHHIGRSRPTTPMPTSPRPTTPRPTSPRPTTPVPSSARTRTRSKSPRPPRQSTVLRSHSKSPGPGARQSAIKSRSKSPGPRQSVAAAAASSRPPMRSSGKTVASDLTTPTTTIPPPKRKKPRPSVLIADRLTGKAKSDPNLKRQGRPMPKRDLSMMDIA